MLYKWNHTVYNVLGLAFFSHSIIPWGSIQVVVSLGGSFLLLDVFHDVVVPRFVQLPLKNIWVELSLGLL